MWTKDPPKEPGWYWARDTFDGRVVVMLARVEGRPYLETVSRHRQTSGSETFQVLRGAAFHDLKDPSMFWSVNHKTVEFSTETIPPPEAKEKTDASH
jgi:hypothetical protein